MKLFQRLICLALCLVLFVPGCSVLDTPAESDPTTDGTQSTTGPANNNGGNNGNNNGGNTQNPGGNNGNNPGGENPGGNNGGENPGGNNQNPGGNNQNPGGNNQNPGGNNGSENPGGNNGGNQDPTPLPPPVQPTPDDGIVDIGYDPLPVSEEELYNQLFDLDNKIDLYLDMPASELQKIQDDYDRYRSFGSKSPIYRMGTLKVTITTDKGTTVYRINEVGVRMKGNTSRTDFYNSHDGIYKYIHLKLDFQETFDDPKYYGNSAKVWANEEDRDARKDRTFAGLEQLEMRWNKCYDATYLRETYAYAMYRSEDVMAPLTNLCSFDWSKLHMGVFCIVEPVDKAFLEKRLPEGDADGDLYKCGWTNQPANFTSTGSIGIEDEDSGKFYCYDLKNNKKTSTHAALKNLINKLNSPTLTKEGLAQLVDIDNFLSFAAVSYFLGNPDDIRNNYNNFYLYFVPSTGKAMFIPYDYDRCLGLTYEYDPSGNGVTQDDPFSDTPATGGRQKNPLFVKTVVKGGFYVKEFATVLKRVAANPMLKSETFDTWFYRANDLYSGDVQPSKKLYNAEGRDFRFSLADGIGGNMSIKTYLSRKMSTYNRYIGNADDYANYQPPTQTVYYIRGGFNGWSDQSQYAMTIKDGKATITLTIKENTHNPNENRFKVYNSITQLWYNTVSEDTTVSYSYAGNSQNILLNPGRYKIVFDIETELITITAA